MYVLRHFGRRPAGSGNITRVVEHDYIPQCFEYTVVLIRRSNSAVAKGWYLELAVFLGRLLFRIGSAAHEIAQTTVDIVIARRIKR